MALTGSQFYFFAKEKVIHCNIPIEVKQIYNIKMKDGFVTKKTKISECGLYNVYMNKEHTNFIIGYYDYNERTNIKKCSYSYITHIEDQEVSRFYIVVEELLGNKNTQDIEEPTDVINTSI